MATAFLICGPVGAGKTSLARELEVDEGAVRLSLDEWMIKLFGHHMSRAVFDERVSACLDVFVDLAERLLALGIDVALDAGFWKRAVRERVTAQLQPAGRVELVFLDAPEGARWARIQSRNANLGEGTFEITRAMFEAFEKAFEPPTPDTSSTSPSRSRRRSGGDARSRRATAPSRSSCTGCHYREACRR